MKKRYEKPLYFAESYVFNASIASCAIDIDTTEPICVTVQETNLCANGTDGHVYGGQNGKKGTVRAKDGKDVITIFNDGNDKTACEYDWDGRKNIVAQTGDNFAVSFYGNNSNEDNHAPGYKGQAFLS